MADPFDGMLRTGTYLMGVGYLFCCFCLFEFVFFLQTLLSEKKKKDFFGLRGPLIFKERTRLHRIGFFFNHVSGFL